MAATNTFDSNLANLELIEEMFAKFEQDPASVDASWRTYFAHLDHQKSDSASSLTTQIDQTAPKDIRVYNLLEAYRTFGHLEAKINPIATQPIEQPWQLKLETLGFSPQELKMQFPTCGLLETATASLQEIIDTLKSIYCNKIGIEYMGLQKPEMEKWLQEHIEPSRFRIHLTMDQKHMILQQLNRSELFESFLHTKFTAQKRFSLEGGETLIPMLESIIETGSQLGLEEFVIGMAHRGRLNVLSNILRKSYSDIFSEFEDSYIPNSFEGSGDVKYHKGFSSTVEENGKSLKVYLAPNPSHLEAVDPVVEGQVRARQVLTNDDVNQNKVVPVLVHGDAAISGQGVVYETLQLYKVPGYSTGGTIHLVINNQIGFTANPLETRSTYYCTDIARAFSAPVFHVNAEDPEGCVYATNLAVELRQKFHCDVFIDLNCYRKYGHNESDEPAYTQPLEYQLIRQKKPIREIYRDELIHHGLMEKELAVKLEKEFTQELHQALEKSKSSIKTSEQSNGTNGLKPPSDPIKTSVSQDVLKQVAKAMSVIPEGFNIHPKLRTLVQERLSMLEGTPPKPIDWGMAELLAYGTLLWEGVHVRISGQDSRRGTFSHRHAAWIDQKTGEPYFPLSHLKEKQGRFEVYNSILSEFAVLGFEFGYSYAYQDALVIWEAQFGDFVNGAQVITDQFMTPGEQKWGRKCGVTLFLPHGYEGQGPEHSSGRMERFLSLAGNDNIRIVYPTTPSQFFHLLRCQVLNPVRKPLIVFTPKGLLRNPDCVSQITDLSQGQFLDVIENSLSTKPVKRLVFCTGRIYYDLLAERNKTQTDDMALVRVEKLYPLSTEQISELIKKHSSSIQECFWAQEEPQNMGAWEYMRGILPQLLPKEIQLQYAGRARSASPAAGSYALHKKENAAILQTLFGK
jgi:2-oxoglutarate dehydrogenase E1 component